ncbi:uncharacterized protein K452DRAFT_354637 [Aplosporella prunicola CBS 121167]|uniref:Uncharacterized protein n=1 Tax=Aplosporella prunicola CBS 121167 TaxID=1176127 RepID=A0A6A6BV93_9PEZI|nr:uncharacterized protein K452DRAFT_354637 [Aplosporella prunicola CBS 121167]KAF2147185.1 hypothetical protein K452DRAFT_354637 [Aplosporella prunicola CBS 121167]
MSIPRCRPQSPKHIPTRISTGRAYPASTSTKTNPARAPSTSTPIAFRPPRSISDDRPQSGGPAGASRPPWPPYTIPRESLRIQISTRARAQPSPPGSREPGCVTNPSRRCRSWPRFAQKGKRLRCLGPVA